MKEKGNSLIIFLIVTGVIGALIVSTLYFKNTSVDEKKDQSSPTSDQKTPVTAKPTKTYQLKNLKISLEISNNWQITEKISFVDLISAEGKINIGRIATNFTNLSDYLEDFDLKRKIKVQSENALMIDKYNSINRIEIFEVGAISNQKVYFIFVNSWIYSLSTSSPELYDDLDQIAQSFRYTP